MKFLICSPGNDEADVISDIHLQAMRNNTLLHVQFPTEEGMVYLHQWLSQQTREHIRHANKKVLVAKDKENGQIVGFVKWLVYATGEPTENEPVQDDLKLPESACQEYLDSYADATKMARQKVLGSKPFFHVTFLCTKPDFNGRGAGSTLMRQVMDEAAADGIPVLLESTMEAVSFYEKLGYETQERLKFMIPPPGNIKEPPSELYAEEVMTWSPTSNEG